MEFIGIKSVPHIIFMLLICKRQKVTAKLLLDFFFPIDRKTVIFFGEARTKDKGLPITATYDEMGRPLSDYACRDDVPVKLDFFSLLVKHSIGRSNIYSNVLHKESGLFFWRGLIHKEKKKVD